MQIHCRKAGSRGPKVRLDSTLFKSYRYVIHEATQCLKRNEDHRLGYTGPYVKDAAV